MKKILRCLMLVGAIGFGVSVHAAEPSLHEVYQAANAGKLDEAQRMMQGVLQAHPNSGKAHYVEAELLAKQGRIRQAASELSTAEKLAPGLPFASVQAVNSLKAMVNKPAAVPTASAPHLAAAQSAEPARFSLGMLLIGLGMIAFVLWAVNFMGRQTAASGSGGPYQCDTTYRNPYPAAPAGGQWPQPGMSPAASNGGSMGSGILGGLATGAAVGAGMVAGEALMHRFMDGSKAAPAASPGYASFDSIPALPSTPLDDMGGNDFGISDTAAWDDNTSAGDSDWT